mmetsp:Transcript_1432/g.3278  ORF Transcript_1432/g.3278 Transcript_1432/m.3278 type:complete len:270 (-) Transcript_1432:483-1292(-)
MVGLQRGPPRHHLPPPQRTLAHCTVDWVCPHVSSGVSRLAAAPLAGSMCLVQDLRAERGEHDQDADAFACVHRMAKEDDGEHHREELADRLNRSEHKRPEGADHVENEKLPDSGADRHQQHVPRQLGRASQEGEHVRGLARASADGDEESAESEERREEIDEAHHLHAAHLVLLEELRLPIRSEGVRRHIRHEQQHADRLRVLYRSVVLLAQLEEHHAGREHEREGVLDGRVALAHHGIPHQHDRHHLAGLGEHLRREGDELERLVLAG